MCIYIYICIYLYIYIYIYMYMYMYVCVYIYIYVYIHVYTHMHIYNNVPPSPKGAHLARAPVTVKQVVSGVRKGWFSKSRFSN